MTTDYKNKDEIPDFKPPEPGEASGWHCWHEQEAFWPDAGCIGSNHKPPWREYICCQCGGIAHYQFKKERHIPNDHGPFYPDKQGPDGEWKFLVIGNTPYICSRNPDAIIP